MLATGEAVIEILKKMERYAEQIAEKYICVLQSCILGLMRSFKYVTKKQYINSTSLKYIKYDNSNPISVSDRNDIYARIADVLSGQFLIAFAL